MGVHFLTFHDGISVKYKIAADQLMDWAHQYGLFDTIVAATFRTVEHEPDFQHMVPFVRANKRGFGYWTWKPFAIRKALRALRPGDMLVYMDACTKLNLEGKPRFLEYLQWVKESAHGTLVIGSKHRVREWCKMDLILALNGHTLLDHEMLMAGIVFLTHTPAVMDFLDRWCSLVSIPAFVDDSPSTVPNHPDFREHRHDQSIFTLLFYNHRAFDGCRVIPDAEYYFPDKRSEDLVYPIWIQSNHY